MDLCSGKVCDMADSVAAHRAAVAGHYDSRASTYDKSPLHTGLVEVVADIIGDPGQTVVDVATGTGLMLRAINSRWHGRTLVGVELSASMVQAAAAALPEALLIRADAASLPLRDGVADLVTCVTALHLFPDAAAALKECVRVLRPGGRVVTASFASVSEPPRRQQDFVRRHADYRSPQQMMVVLADQGLEMVQHAVWAHEDDQLLICVATGRSGCAR